MLNNIKILEKVIEGRAIISDQILWDLIKQTINTEELIEETPINTIIEPYQANQEPERTKGLTEDQKETIKISINKLKAIMETEDEEERRERQKYNDYMNKQINDINTEAVEETFNYKDPRQVKILLNAARIELF